MMEPSLRRAVLVLFGGLLACGPGKEGDDTSGGASTGSSTDAATTGAPTTTTTSTTTSTTTTTATTTSTPSTTDAPTTSTGTSDTSGGEPGCAAGWELPASIFTSLKISPPDASVGEFDPEATYPDGTPAACIRWDGEALAGVRLAFGPTVDDGPQGRLEIVVDDGEREYGTNSWPAEPGAYDGISVVFTLAAEGELPRTWDYAADEGIGPLWATWVPRRTGEHIILDAKLTIPAVDPGAQVGFYIDAVVAPASPPDAAFCEGLDASFKCDTAGCGGWLTTEAIADPTTCVSKSLGTCFAELASTDDETYDSTFWQEIDGAVRLRRVGGEACHSFGPEHPGGWSECGVGPNDPPECKCACALGVCPGDTALALLDGCGLAKPCADIENEGQGDSKTYDCSFQALAAGDPAALRVHVNLGDPDWHDRVYLRGDGTASWLHGECDVSCIGSCEDRDWGVPRTCTLREPAFFTACAATVDPGVQQGCQDLSTWFTDCAVVSPSSCP